ncbi:MAG: hypothetical protein N3G74_02730 [Candidatus Micrarchaeota archaeon]|nr:hypothetical protein [Candidatus Micrarchaeota archaeon]
MANLEDSITQNVRDALNGDIEACRRLNLLLQLPFSSIQKLFHTSEESKYALSFIAALKAKENDRDAINYCRKHIPDAIPRAMKV